MGSPYDYPLSSRLDENDAVFIMDKVLVPWENGVRLRRPRQGEQLFPAHRVPPRFVVHGCTRLA
jgi:4-hydroxyphenylacetate 3-monooxygenase